MSRINILAPQWFVIGAVALAASATSIPASAACTRYGDNMSWRINPGEISVRHDTVPGTVIYTRELTTVRQGIAILECSSASDASQYIFRSGSAVPGFSNVYTTGITGVGVRIRDSSNRYYGTPGDRYIIGAGTISGTMTPFIYELLVTGPITPGRLTIGRQGDWNVSGMSPFAPIDVTGGSVSVPRVCSVTTPNITVPLGDNIKSSEFYGIGTTSSNTLFSIGLDCLANTNVKMQLDGVAEASGRPGTFALNPIPGTATGLGIEVLYNDAPVTIGTPLSVGRSGVGNGPYEVELVARFVQTAGRVTGGPARGSATFTMTYN